MSALGCGPEGGGGGAWRTASATDTKAASSATRCGLGSAVRYSASAEASGSRRRSSRSRAENRTHDAAAKEDRPSGNDDSASGLRPEAGCRASAARSWSRRMNAPRARRTLSATRHLRATAASPCPEAAARRRSTSAAASDAAERREPRPKARSASMCCADGGAVLGW
uniref:Uncharacterized protein n=1 Tax=Zea mays TaxID=4577 RepID=B6TWD0_MAIZE|nr:hypothetical protein [Zea mays]